MEMIQEGGITTAQGFQVGVAQAGIKKPGRYDLAVIHSQYPCTAAGVFTKNKVQAAPIKISKAHLSGGAPTTIVVNSGCANACTGAQGEADAKAMASFTAQGLGCTPEEVLVASTGVIGAYMPMDKIGAGIKEATSHMSAKHGHQAALAIMTTDTRSKEVAVEILLDGKKVRIGAIAKGSGMIHPDMATMLGFVTTDASIEQTLLQRLLKEVVDVSFNMVTVDGDTSTNDCLFILTNGASGIPEIRQEKDKGFQQFKEALTYVCVELAKMIAKDGEGASKFLSVKVEGASSENDARIAAKTIARSSLVKAAIYGRDANWGRVLCALGYSGASFNPEKVDMYLGSIQMMEQGRGLVFDEEAAKAYFEQDQIDVLVRLHDGEEQAQAWGCDLTHDYVSINADYRS